MTKKLTNSRESLHKDDEILVIMAALENLCLSTGSSLAYCIDHFILD
jgi:hypothetical protein